MATNSTLTPEYLAQSKTRMVSTMYAIPIGLEAFSTGWRLWAAASAQSGWFSFDDYLMLFATGDYIFSHFYDIAIAFTKLSVLALYHRIFITRTFRILVIGTACFVGAWVIVMEVVLGFGCQPIQAWWDASQGKCIDKEAFTYFTNVTNMVTDIWIFMMPIPVILGLQAAKEKRAILCFMFGVGLATCAISAARLSFVFGVASADFTWDEASLGILSAWEPCGAILCANFPQIYRHLIIIRDTLRAGVRSVTHSRSAATAAGSDRRGGYKGSLQHHDWAKLNNSDGLSGETNRTVTEVSAQKWPTMSVEMDELKSGGIMVQRAFTQSSAHDLLAIAAGLIKAITRDDLYKSLCDTATASAASVGRDASHRIASHSITASSLNSGDDGVHAHGPRSPNQLKWLSVNKHLEESGCQRARVKPQRRRLQFSPDKGPFLLRREDIKDGKPPPRVLSIDYDDDGELLMTSASDETIQIYNVREGRHDKSLLSKKYGVKLAKFTHTRSSIIYASTKQNHAIRYLATHDNSFIRYFEGHDAAVTALAVHPGSDNFISCSQDNTVRLWDTQTKHWQGQLFLRSPYLAAYDPSGTVFAVACPSSGTVLMYDVRNYDKAPFATIDVVEQCRGVDSQCLVKGWTKLEFSNDGKSILVGTKGRGHFLLDAFQGNLKAYLRRPAGGTRRLAAGENLPANGTSPASAEPSAFESSGDCCFAPDGRFVLSGGAKQDVLVWDTLKQPPESKVLDPTWTLPDNKREAAVLAFNPRFNFFATADQDLVLWLPDPHA
ncbi:wd repeat containing 82 [Trichoderma arundinaceum]|uniref:Wd repeat containing 82 n=1 Tax=Trichoderma arundinaceum TaxID=490622 RepID=A0A395NH87_TRIAR|nr:wd repeat containing 82 [Trichoderma arundinaceum]